MRPAPIPTPPPPPLRTIRKPYIQVYSFKFDQDGKFPAFSENLLQWPAVTRP